MKIDYTYIEGIELCNDGKVEESLISDSVGFRAINSHSELTGTDFELRYIHKALRGEGKYFGLTNLRENITEIKDLLDYIHACERNIIKTVENELMQLFSIDVISRIVISPVLGYDHGIGMNGVVAVNLNNPTLFTDNKELISLLVHEAAHVAYEILRRPMSKEYFWSFRGAEDVKKSLDYFIQYEGVGLFAADRYRQNQGMKNKDSIMQEDYNYERNMDLMKKYQEIVGMLKREPEKHNEALEIVGKYRIPHRLGYAIMKRVALDLGIDAIKEVITMKNEEFVNRYLL